MTAVALVLLGIVIGAVWHAYATRLDRIARDAEAADRVARAETFAQECLDDLAATRALLTSWKSAPVGATTYLETTADALEDALNGGAR